MNIGPSSLIRKSRLIVRTKNASWSSKQENNIEPLARLRLDIFSFEREQSSSPINFLTKNVLEVFNMQLCIGKEKVHQQKQVKYKVLTYLHVRRDLLSCL